MSEQQRPLHAWDPDEGTGIYWCATCGVVTNTRNDSRACSGEPT